jgi:hypothetical protein
VAADACRAAADPWKLTFMSAVGRSVKAGTDAYA